MSELERPSRESHPFLNIDRDGVPWYEAPKPRRWHRCSVWTQGTIRATGSTVYRCACGSISRNGRYWMERNSR